MMRATSGAMLYEIVMDAGRIGASKIIISPVKLLPRTWAGMPKMSFRKSRDSYTVVEKIYYDGKYRHINEVQVWIAKERPKFGKLANEELFKLSSKLDLYLKTQVKESKGSIPF